MIPFLAPLALKLSPIGRFFKDIPWQMWAVGAFVLVVGIGGCIHLRNDKAAVKAAYAQGKKDEGERIAAKAFEIKSKADALTHAISAKLRSKSDETNRRIVGDANALLVRGPGKASCPGDSGIPSAASGHSAPTRPVDVAVAPVPDGERVDIIALPFPPTIEFGRQHDQCQSDLINYREWEAQIRAVWAKIGADR